MTEEVVLNLSSQMFKTMFIVSGPLLVVALGIGLIVSILQTITQINEATLTFVPKVLAIAVVLFVGGPWMLDHILAYTRDLFEQIPRIMR